MLWENVGKPGKQILSTPFFCGSHQAKLDEKNRFVLPQSLRYQLVESGQLEFTIALSMGGCLAIYRKSQMDEIVEKFRAKRHIAKFQKFFTLFFSTLVHTTCDKVGRVTLPTVLKNGVGIENEIIIAGSLDKIELWPKSVYEKDLASFVGGAKKGELKSMMEEAFELLAGDDHKETEDEKLEKVIEKVQKEAEPV